MNNAGLWSVSVSVEDDLFVRNQVLQREIQEMYQTPVEFVEEGNACIGAAMAIADRWEDDMLERTSIFRPLCLVYTEKKVSPLYKCERRSIYHHQVVTQVKIFADTEISRGSLVLWPGEKCQMSSFINWIKYPRNPVLGNLSKLGNFYASRN